MSPDQPQSNIVLALKRGALTFVCFAVLPSLLGAHLMTQASNEARLNVGSSSGPIDPDIQIVESPDQAETPVHVAAPAPAAAETQSDPIATALSPGCAQVDALVAQTHDGRIAAAGGVTSLVGSLTGLLVDGRTSGQTAGWSLVTSGPTATSWRLPDGTTVTFSVREFGTNEDAIAFDEWSMRGECHRVTDTFTVEGIAGSAAITSGQADIVTFIRHGRRYGVNVLYPAGVDHAVTATLASMQNAIAR